MDIYIHTYINICIHTSLSLSLSPSLLLSSDPSTRFFARFVVSDLTTPPVGRKGSCSSGGGTWGEEDFAQATFSMFAQGDSASPDQRARAAAAAAAFAAAGGVESLESRMEQVAIADTRAPRIRVNSPLAQSESEASLADTRAAGIAGACSCGALAHSGSVAGSSATGGESLESRLEQASLADTRAPGTRVAAAYSCCGPVAHGRGGRDLGTLYASNGDVLHGASLVPLDHRVLQAICADDSGAPASLESGGKLGSDREAASSMVTAGATANTTEGNSRASRKSGLVSSHSHGESISSRSGASGGGNTGGGHGGSKGGSSGDGGGGGGNTGGGNVGGGRSSATSGRTPTGSGTAPALEEALSPAALQLHQRIVSLQQKISMSSSLPSQQRTPT